MDQVIPNGMTNTEYERPDEVVAAWHAKPLQTSSRPLQEAPSEYGSEDLRQ